MNTQYKTAFIIVMSMLAGAGIMFVSGSHMESSTTQEVGREDKKPDYWVAPMDANYRRDRPGKSPMGMDLVPVYENMDSPGTVEISPNVVNNIGVRIVPVERKQLRNKIKTVGYIQYDEDKLIHIHPRVSGWVERLYVGASGDEIKKGQALYSLYSPELVNAQEELLLALSRNNSRLVRAAEDRLRSLKLSDQLIRSIKQSKQAQKNVTFYAQQDGVIDNLKIREGFYVEPGITIMSIGELDEVWVEAEVFERQASIVRDGLPVSMSLDYIPERVWEGKIDYIYPSLDAKTRTLRVRLRFENKDKTLKPNMFAQVIIHVDSPQDVIVVPREALIRSEDQDRVVLALGKGRFKSIEVQTGQRDERHVAISQGLQLGDRVVVSAQFLLDSESSKNSDFMRMNHTATKPMEGKGEAVGNTVEAQGLVNDINVEQRVANISRDAITQWQRPPMTMDFVVEESLDISRLKKGQRVNFTLAVIEDQFIIQAIHDQTEKATTGKEFSHD